MTGIDDNDPDSREAAELAAADFTRYLSLEKAQQLRVGVAAFTHRQFQSALEQAITAQEQTLERDLGDDEKQALEETTGVKMARAQPIIDILQAQGIDAVVLDPSEISSFKTAVRSVLEYGFQDSFDRFMDSLGEKAPVSSLAEVVRINNEDLPNRAPYGQRRVAGSVDTDITAEEYEAMVKEQWEGAAKFLRGILEKHDIDVLITSETGEYCAAGFPALSVPDGLLPDGQPTNIVLSGDYLSEPKLIAVGYAYEQATQARQEPDLETTLALIESVTGGGQ
jgi:Asp-tRNA(Asn)/Glu-tRNA(Gln) amidotransferase A subunit family amidase